MKNSRFIKLLKTFTQRDLKAFELYLNSSFFNKSKRLSRLFNIIKEKQPDFLSDKINYESIYNSLFPGKNYNKQILVNLLNKLHLEAENYLVQVSLDKSELLKKHFLLKEYKDRGDYSLFQNEFNKFESEIQEKDLESDNYFLNFLNLNLYKTLIQSSDYPDSNLLIHINNKISDNFILYVLTASMILYNYNLRFETLTKKKLNYNKKYFDNIVSHVNESGYTNIILEIENQRLKLISEPNEFNFYKLKSLKEKYENKLWIGYQDLIWESLFDYCNRPENIYLKKFEKEIFELNKECYTKYFEWQVFPETFMDDITFLNKISNCSSLHQYDWAQIFLKKYKNTLNPKHKEEINKCAIARICMYKKEYDKALNLLQNLKIKSVFVRIDNKFLLFRIYFEIGDFLKADEIVKSGKIILLREKNLSREFYNYSKKTFDLYSKLIQLYEKKDDFTLFKIKNEITNNKNLIAYKTWFIEKIKPFADKI